MRNSTLGLNRPMFENIHWLGTSEVYRRPTVTTEVYR